MMNAAIRRAASLALLTLGGACFSNRAKPAALSLAPNARIDSTGERIHVRMTVAPDLAASRVVDALVRRDLLVSRNQGGIVEATLPREAGLLGQYDIVIRAYVSPADNGGSNVLLLGEEGITTTPGKPVVWRRLNERGNGRALATWRKLREVGAELGR